jgi:hypothetical protein
MSAETEVEEYYGYNSIITQDGKRIRRMRRTEASTEKLIISRLKSASNSRSVSSRRSKLQDNRPGNLSVSMDPNKSKQQSRCTNYLKTHFYKEKIDPQTEYQPQHQTLQNVSKPKHNKIEKSLKDVKEKIGEYYLGEARASRQSSSRNNSKNRSRSKKESQIQVERKTGPASVPQTPKPPEISDYCMSPIASKKKIKRF